MELKKLFQGIQHLTFFDPQETIINGICFDSRKAGQGDIFFALPGVNSDGHDYILQAIGNGAVACVVSKELRIPKHIAQVKVEDTRRIMAICASRFYGHPTADIPCVGITGTNGKTTTSYLVESIMRSGGIRPAVIGTIENRYNDIIEEASRTTPESIDAIRSIIKFTTAGATGLAMEVSSHALAQHRVDGIAFDIGVFTNLTRDHLDYHQDMDSYFEAKSRLFTELVKRNDGRSIINIDDNYGRKLAKIAPRPLTYSLDKADIHPSEEMTVDLNGIHGIVITPAGPVEINSPMIGQYNLQNILCAVATGIALGIPTQRIENGIKNMRSVPGRMQRVDNKKDITALVDYAHTDDALKNALLAVKELNPKRIITVFGCGGDRDRTKRPAMGAIAGEMSDIAIVTSDNPRTEDPTQILNDICDGLTTKTVLSVENLRDTEQSGLIVESDRKRAIELAVHAAKPGDVVLVAGKGHENYQIVGNETLHFSDVEELTRALGEKLCLED